MNKTNFIISNRNRRYKVNESQFKNIIKESVKKLIREVGEKHRFGKGAYGLAMDAAKKARSLGRYDQADNLMAHAARYFNKDYSTDGFEMDNLGQLKYTTDSGKQIVYKPESRINRVEKLAGRNAYYDAINGNERIKKAASTAKAFPRKRRTAGLNTIDAVDAQLNTESINRTLKKSNRLHEDIDFLNTDIFYRVDIHEPNSDNDVCNEYFDNIEDAYNYAKQNCENNELQADIYECSDDWGDIESESDLDEADWNWIDCVGFIDGQMNQF